jgi:hypothetical protein
LRKKLRRKDVVAFFEALAPTVIAIEACGASHHWESGHSLKPPGAKPVIRSIKKPQGGKPRSR